MNPKIMGNYLHNFNKGEKLANLDKTPIATFCLLFAILVLLCGCSTPGHFLEFQAENPPNNIKKVNMMKFEELVKLSTPSKNFINSPDIDPDFVTIIDFRVPNNSKNTYLPRDK